MMNSNYILNWNMPRMENYSPIMIMEWRSHVNRVLWYRYYQLSESTWRRI